MSHAPFLRRRHLLRWLPLALMPVGPARAQVTVEGYTYARETTVGGVTLRLNGVGLRAVAWFKGYGAGLYLGRKATTVDAVLADSGPKRLRLRLFVDVPAAEFVKAFYKGIERNTPPAQQPGLAARMQRFDSMVSSLKTLKTGDLVDLDFLPDEGLVFSHNGRRVGEALPGADFYAALLLIFIGQRPADKEMKIGLLGGPVG
jgi:hypothetical protein